MASINLDRSTSRSTRSGVKVESIKNLQIMFLICVGIISIFIITGLRSGGAKSTANANRALLEGKNEISYSRLTFKIDPEKTENERKRDELFLEYARSSRRLEQLGVINRTKRLPDVICAGVEKCGTGPLRAFLSSHPLILSNVKEPHFFDSPKYKLGMDYYKSMLASVTPFELSLEKTPAYFDSSIYLPGVIKSKVPNAKIIFVLCDPVNRTYSDYVHEIVMGNIPKEQTYDILASTLLLPYAARLNAQINDHKRQLEYIHTAKQNKMISHVLTLGLYYYHLMNWFRVYDRSQIHIVNGDEFIENPAKVIEELQTFLELPQFIIPEDFTLHESGFYCVSSPKAVMEDDKLTVEKTPICLGTGGKGRTRKGRSGIPDKGTTERLRKFYAPFNEKLFKLLGRRFNW